MHAPRRNVFAVRLPNNGMHGRVIEPTQRGGPEEAANYAFCTVPYMIPASKSETCDHMYLDFSSIHIISSLGTSSGNISKGPSNEVPLEFTPISLH